MATRKRLEIKIPEREWERIQTTSKMLEMTYTEVVRNALRFGLASLIKFETGNKPPWQAQKKSGQPKTSHKDQQDDKPKIEETQSEDDAEIERMMAELRKATENPQ